MRNHELFPYDRSLLLRMALVAVFTPLLVIAIVVGAILALPNPFQFVLAGVIVCGATMATWERNRLAGGAVLREQDAPELFATVDRLCAVADLPRPELVLERESQPNSWIVAAPGRRPRLHVTKPLLELLDRNELQAVLAHELSHLASRDAAVMTVVGMPGTVLLAGARRASRAGWWLIIVGAMIAAAIGSFSRLGTNALSRYRELAADQGAAAITGHPSALASALLKVSSALAQLPTADLRAVAARDGFHLVATGANQTSWRALNRLLNRFSATHPPLARRLAALEQLERHAQRARPAL